MTKTNVVDWLKPIITNDLSETPRRTFPTVYYDANALRTWRLLAKLSIYWTFKESINIIDRISRTIAQLPWPHLGSSLFCVIERYYEAFQLFIVFAFESGTVWRRRRAQAWSLTSEPARAAIGAPRMTARINLAQRLLCNACARLKFRELWRRVIFARSRWSRGRVGSPARLWHEQAIPVQTSYEMKTPPCDVVRVRLKEKVYTYSRAWLWSKQGNLKQV